MAVAGGDDAFQKDCWGDDDEYEEEDDGQNASWGSRQREAKEAGMIQVGAEGWREAVKRKLSEITGPGLNWEEMDNAIDAVEKAGKATCVVRRGCDSPQRLSYHERMAEAASSTADREKHCKKAVNAKNNKRGVGTGLLLWPRCPLGYIVITNSHVVMNEEEAKDARITFNYLIDGREDGMKKFDVEKFLAWSPPTTSGADEQNLDFCLLLVKATTEEEAFLHSRGIPIEESGRIQATDDEHLKFSGLNDLPLIMFSHPRSLALRISVGKCPKEIKQYPVRHIKHNIPTLQGSSGANILLSSIIDKEFKHWMTAFVHYRHGCAVAWQAIGPQIRDYFATLNARTESEREEELWDKGMREKMMAQRASDVSKRSSQTDYIHSWQK